MDLAEISLIAGGGGLFLFGVAYILNRRRVKNETHQNCVNSSSDILSPVQEELNEEV